MRNDVALGSPTRPSWLHLVQEAAAGNEAAANELLAEVRPALQAEVAARLGGNHDLGPADASDVVQECLLALWRHLQKVHGTTEGEIRALVKTIARHECLDTLRHARSQGRDAGRQVPLAQDSHGGVPIAAGDSSPSQLSMRREEDESRERALTQLSVDDQAVLQLRFRECQAWSEVASRMRRSEDAVKRLYYRAVKRWKQAAGAEQ